MQWLVRRIYQRGFRDLDCCVISALGYAHIWGKGWVYLGLRVYPELIRNSPLVLFWIRRDDLFSSALSSMDCYTVSDVTRVTPLLNDSSTSINWAHSNEYSSSCYTAFNGLLGWTATRSLTWPPRPKPSPPSSPPALLNDSSTSIHLAYSNAYVPLIVCYTHHLRFFFRFFRLLGWTAMPSLTWPLRLKRSPPSSPPAPFNHSSTSINLAYPNEYAPLIVCYTHHLRFFPFFLLLGWTVSPSTWPQRPTQSPPSSPPAACNDMFTYITWSGQPCMRLAVRGVPKGALHTHSA